MLLVFPKHFISHLSAQINKAPPRFVLCFRIGTLNKEIHCSLILVMFNWSLKTELTVKKPHAKYP